MLEMDEAAGNARCIETKIPSCAAGFLFWAEKFARKWSKVTA
jgi:hypothetical protein